MPQWLVTDVSIILPSVTLTVMLAFFALTDAYIGKDHRKVLLAICALMLILIAQNYCDMLLQGRYVNTSLRTAVSVIGYILRPVILTLFCHVVSPKGRFYPAWTLAAVNGAVYMTAFFSPLTFRICEYNHFHEGPLRFTCHAVSAVLLFYLLFLSVRKFRTAGARNNWVPLLAAILIVGSVVMDSNVQKSEQPVTFLTMAIVLSSNFYYVWLHLQFVRTRERELLAGQRVQIMLSQIQPHFLFNSLEVIRRLYRKDPEKAEVALLKFERYLRGNMDSLSQDEPIPFQTELEHTKLYLELEQLRFPDELRIAYDLSCTGFPVPSLTLQPLAENAVRHGVRGKKSGEGTVTIATREYDDRFEITVTDDGNGFDPNLVPQDGQSHVGLSNVRERLRCAGASLRIESGPEGGTEAAIIIPKIVNQR
ncbi:MAG: histidine kinase [Clostridia bacterium]|nr:histidine kinase [Clostridia bacterium]